MLILEGLTEIGVSGTKIVSLRVNPEPKSAAVGRATNSLRYQNSNQTTFTEQTKLISIELQAATSLALDYETAPPGAANVYELQRVRYKAHVSNAPVEMSAETTVSASEFPDDHPVMRKCVAYDYAPWVCQ